MAQAHQHGSVLFAGQELAKSEQLRSENGLFELIMQCDGNFVEYKGPVHTPSHAVWNTGKISTPGKACLHRDGRLVVVDACGRQTWANTDKPLKEDCYKLVLQNDGSAVIYDSHDLPVWSNHGFF